MGCLFFISLCQEFYYRHAEFNSASQNLNEEILKQVQNDRKYRNIDF